MAVTLGRASMRVAPQLDDVLTPNLTIPLANMQKVLPQLAKDRNATLEIRRLLSTIDTTHEVILGDARNTSLPANSVHLVVTSPPYWNLKKYPDTQGQLGRISDYDRFLEELSKVWRNCFRTLVPGGRLVCVVGDVCLSRRSNKGRHTVIPLHAEIQRQCREIGFDNLAPIIWYKIANMQTEVTNRNGSYLGKPYEPNGIVKNDIEYVLMLRKPGYRSPTPPARILSLIASEDHGRWFRQIWGDIPGASTRKHPAPFPLKLAERLIRMFSFAGDTVLDPFAGTGTTQLAAKKCGRNSIGIEIDPRYTDMAKERLA